jgi:hypothetical protein
MAQCVVIDGGGVVTASAADPCPGFVVLTPTEYGSFLASPFSLSAEDGATVSIAIIGVWAVAFAFRALAKALHTDGEVNE